MPRTQVKTGLFCLSTCVLETCAYRTLCYLHSDVLPLISTSVCCKHDGKVTLLFGINSIDFCLWGMWDAFWEASWTKKQVRLSSSVRLSSDPGLTNDAGTYDKHLTYLYFGLLSSCGWISMSSQVQRFKQYLVPSKEWIAGVMHLQQAWKHSHRAKIHEWCDWGKKVPFGRGWDICVHKKK